MKKFSIFNFQFSILFLIILLGILILPFTSLAAGLVPCGGPGEPACRLCHLFVLFKNIVDFLLVPSPINKNIPFVPIIAVLFLVAGGVMYIMAYLPGSPLTLQQANNLFTSVVWGLFIIYGAWLIVNLFFQVIGVQEWTGLKTWWQIPCPI